MASIINSTVIESLSAEFAQRIQSDRYVAKHFEGFTAADVLRATYAFAESVASHRNISNGAFQVGAALQGSEVFDEAGAKEAARIGFIFANEFSEFDGIARLPRNTYAVENGVATYNRAYSFVLGDKSRLAKALGEGTLAATGLRAEPFSDYDATGYNAEGQSFYLKGKHSSAQVAASAIAGINAVQRQAYESNDAIRLAARAYAELSQRAKAVDKAGLVKEQNQGRNLVRAGKATKDSYVVDVQDISAAKVNGLAEGSRFIVENGRGYVRYAADARGRQYAVGTFNHFDTGVLALVLEARHIAEEIVEDAGTTVAKAVEALNSFLEGDDKGGAFFFRRATGVTRGGKTVVKADFDYKLFAAAITLAA